MLIVGITLIIITLIICGSVVLHNRDRLFIERASTTQIDYLKANDRDNRFKEVAGELCDKCKQPAFNKYFQYRW